MHAAILENHKNAPPVKRAKLFGASSMSAPAKMALEAGKKWADGKTLNVFFLDGTATQKQRVIAQAMKWTKFANVKFNFSANKSAAHLRVSFVADDGSWSYIGTDNLGIPKTKPTMNFGWLRDDTDDAEYERVVVHEFGHVLGAIHEHQNPKGGILWNLPAVYAYFAGAPNFWSKEDTDINVVSKYSVDQLNASKFDRLDHALPVRWRTHQERQADEIQHADVQGRQALHQEAVPLGAAESPAPAAGSVGLRLEPEHLPHRRVAVLVAGAVRVKAVGRAMVSAALPEIRDVVGRRKVDEDHVVARRRCREHL